MQRAEELVADSSALIYIAKADAFACLSVIRAGLAVVPGVWSETVTEGRHRGYADVGQIEAAAAGGWLRAVELDVSEVSHSVAVASEERLGRGESEVIAYAGAGGRRALIDDRRSLRAARARRVTAFSTLALGLLARRAGQPLEQSLDLARDLAAAAGARADVLAQYERCIREEHP